MGGARSIGASEKRNQGRGWAVEPDCAEETGRGGCAERAGLFFEFLQTRLRQSAIFADHVTAIELGQEARAADAGGARSWVGPFWAMCRRILATTRGSRMKTWAAPRGSSSGYRIGRSEDRPRRSAESSGPRPVEGDVSRRWRAKRHWQSCSSPLRLPGSAAEPSLRWSTRRSDGCNAYLRRVRNETVRITHPCHPFGGCELAVLHYRPTTESLSVVVEMPDGSARSLPLSWTDRALPGEQDLLSESDCGRLSGRAVLEILQLLATWDREGG